LNGETERIVTKEEYGNAWPFTIDEGTIKNENDAVIFEAEGFRFGLNSKAMGQEYKDINAIWNNRLDIVELSKTINEMIDIGMEL